MSKHLAVNNNERKPFQKLGRRSIKGPLSMITLDLNWGKQVFRTKICEVSGGSNFPSQSASPEIEVINVSHGAKAFK